MADHLANMHAGFQAPSPWVRRWAGLVPAGSAVLDLACGSGRHGRLFLKQGHPTCFLDKDVRAVADLRDQPGARIMECDLETGASYPLAGDRFGSVIVTCYLHRPILPDILAGVAPGGVLIYETFARGNEAYGHPAREAYLLEEAELLDAVSSDFTIRAYEHGYDPDPKPGIRQRICAIRKGDSTKK